MKSHLHEGPSFLLKQARGEKVGDTPLWGEKKSKRPTMNKQTVWVMMADMSAEHGPMTVTVEVVPAHYGFIERRVRFVFVTVKLKEKSSRKRVSEDPLDVQWFTPSSSV